MNRAIFSGLIGGVLVALGTVWLLQGLNVMPGSFMTGSFFWAVVGALCIAVGLGFLGSLIRRGGGRR
jgi:hypothetical protein